MVYESGRDKRKITVAENEVHLDEDAIFHIVLIGEVDENIAEDICKAIHEINDRFGKKTRNTYVDLNNLGKISYSARNRLKKLSMEFSVGKIAFYGLHPVSRMLASFGMGLSKKSDMRFFKTKEKALSWLREGQKISEANIDG